MIAKPNLPIFAHGGDVVTTRSRFLKVSDAFRHDTEKTDYDKVGKGGSMSKMVEKPAVGRQPKRNRK